MTHKRLQQTMRHALKYPLPVRIAAALHLEGVTLAQYHADCMKPDTREAEYRQIDFVIVNDVYIALSAIEHGRVRITQQLRAYAQQIST